MKNLIEYSDTTEVHVHVPAAKGAGEGYREVDIEVFECPFCNGSLGLDSSYLDQVNHIVNCPYCSKPIVVYDPNDDDFEEYELTIFYNATPSHSSCTKRDVIRAPLIQALVCAARESDAGYAVSGVHLCTADTVYCFNDGELRGLHPRYKEKVDANSV